MDSDGNLVWIDLEMTGLNPEKDVILEIASIVTDSSLTVIEEGPALVIYQSETFLISMEPIVRTIHTESGLLDLVRSSTITTEQAQQRTLDFISRYCKPNVAILAGNSIWQDRAFLVRYMPELMNFFHYRMVDVTTVKELIKRWYPNDIHQRFTKKNTHRALSDIRESLDELRHYRKYFFVEPGL